MRFSSARLASFLMLVLASSIFLQGLSLQAAEAVRLVSTVWYLHPTTAYVAFGTDGPTSEQSAMTDLVTNSPTSKTTALSMDGDPGASTSTVIGTETSASAGNMWFRTFLSPKLAAQTIASGTTFRMENGLTTNNTLSGMTYKVHVYLWRQGTGKIASFFDGSATACGVVPSSSNVLWSQVCVTTASGSNVTVLDGDQIALEVWIHANNAASTSYNATMTYNNTGIIGNGSTTHTGLTGPLSSLTVNRALAMQSTSDHSTTWYLRDDSSASIFGKTGPTAEYSSATDAIPGQPASKGTAKTMQTSPGSSQVTLSFTETDPASIKIWMGTFLSPPLAAQTIASGTGYRYEGAFFETNAAANIFFRLHVYIWREGTGYVASGVNSALAGQCGTEMAIAQYSNTCIGVTSAAMTLQAGDQIALELWATPQNTVTTSYSGSIYYGGDTMVENGAGGHVITNPRSSFGFNKRIEELTTLSMDNVNASGASVGSPAVVFTPAYFSNSNQSTTATLGDSSQKIRITNWDSSKTWTVSFAPTAGSTATWSNGALTYDFNDGGGGTDGADNDLVGGRLTVDPSVGSVSPAYGCATTTGLSLGSSSSYAEGSVNSISLLVADSSASYNCAWDLMGVSLSQLIPAEQSGGAAYSIGFTLSIL